MWRSGLCALHTRLAASHPLLLPLYAARLGASRSTTGAMATTTTRAAGAEGAPFSSSSAVATAEMEAAASHEPLLHPPPGLARATSPAALAALLPSSYPIARFRRRSIEARGARVRYKPHAGEQPGAPRAAGDGSFISSSGGGGSGNSNAAAAAGAPRPPSDSYIEVTLPFATNAALRDEYERFSMGRVRLGLVLEDVDSLAADIAARHLAEADQPLAVVTASMDRLQLVSHEQHRRQLHRAADDAAAAAAAATSAVAATPPQQRRAGAGAAAAAAAGPRDDPLLIGNDLRLAGCVTWVGRSSLEVTIELADRPPPPMTASSQAVADGGEAADGDRGGWRRRGVAHFVMVVRGADPGRAPPLRVSPLAPGTPNEEELCQQAARRQEARRAKRAAEAAEGAGGSSTERQQQQQRFLGELVARAAQHGAGRWYSAAQRPKDGAGAISGAIASGHDPAAPPAVPMASTSLQTPVIMHHQDRNITGGIFGGHILRSAYEAAYATAALHAGCHPEPLAMSDVAFVQPITVGSIVEFDAKVVLTHGELMRVAVRAIKHEPAALAAGGDGDGTATSGGGLRQQGLHVALTTTFSFLLAAPPGARVRPVRPDTLEDAADWLLAVAQHAEDGYPAPPVADWGSAPPWA